MPAPGPPAMTGVPTMLCAAILIGLAAIAPVSAAADPASFRWPSSAAATPLRALVEAYNSGDSARLVAFVRAHYPARIAGSRAAERVAAYWTSVRREFGPATPHGVLASSERSTEVWMRGDVSAAWFTLQLEVSADSAKVAGAGVGRGISPRAAKPPAPVPPARLAAEIGAYLRRLDHHDLFSGAVLVAHHDRVVFRGAAGRASREHGVRNRVDTRFNVASVAKMFTAAAVLRLVADRRLSLDDSIAAWVPAWPRPHADQVTLRHLLTHTSGIELDDDSLFNAEAENARTLGRVVDAQIRALARHQELLAGLSAGRFDYTNEGFDLAGAIVERAGGRPFHEFMANEVFARAGMTSSGPLERDGSVPGLATGYTSRDGALSGNVPGPRRTNALWLSVYGRPSGQSYSTVEDLWRFVRALRGHRLLPAALADAMLSPQIGISSSDEPREDYGFGVEIKRRGSTMRLGHSGGLPGASARVDVYPGLEYTVIVLANEDWTANNVADRIGEWIGAGFSVAPDRAGF